MKKAMSLFLFCLLLVAVCCASAQEISSDSEIGIDQQYILSLSGREEALLVMTADEDPAYYRIDFKNEDVGANVKLELYDRHSLKMEQVSVYTQKSDFISWKAEPGEQYWLLWKSSSDKAEGRVSLQLSKSPDVYANQLENASVISTGEPVLTTLDGTGDEDWLTFTAAEGDAFYRVDFKNEDIASTVYVQLYDENGLKMERISAYKGDEGFLSWAVTPGSAYYLRAYAGTSDRTGRYMLTLSRQADGEPNAIENALPVETGAALDLSLDGTGDEDWLTFTAAEGDAFYRVDFKNEDIASTVYVQLYDENGLKMERISAYKGDESFLSWAVTPGSAYYLRAYAGTSDRTGRYMLTLSRQADGEPNVLENALPVETGAALDLSLDGTGDQDWLTFTAEEGDAFYRVDFKNEDIASTVYVQLYDENGLKMERISAYKGDESFLNWRVTPGSAYYLCAYAGTSDRTGRYALTLSRQADNEADTPELAAGIPVDQLVQASLDGAGDVDVYKLTASEDAAYYQAEFANEMGGGRVLVRLLDHSGRELDRKDAGKDSSNALNWQPEAGAVYYLQVEAGNRTQTGSYSLTLLEQGDPEGDTQEEASPLEAGTLEGTVGSKADIDWFRIDSESSFVQLTVRAGEQGNLRAQVYNHAGKEMQSWWLNAGQEKTAVFAVDSVTPCYLRISAEKACGYTLKRQDEADLGGNTAASAVQSAVGKMVLRFEMENDVDYIAFAAADMKIGLTVAQDTPVSAVLTDADGYPLGDEKYLRAGSYVYAADSQHAFLRVRSSRIGSLALSFCTPEEHAQEPEWFVLSEATCTQDGLKEQRCTQCGEVLTQEAIPAVGHTPGEMQTAREATCTQEGLKEQHCSVCRELLTQEAIPALGHTLSEMQTTLEATCTQEGLKEQHCTVCRKKQTQETIPALGHTPGEMQTALEATCTEEGRKEQHCTLCDELLAQEAIAALGHQYGEWIETKAPTRSEEGVEAQTCYRCGGIQERSVKKLTLMESLFGR
ncbi:MAG: hypothetical protein PUD16_05800 [bacterium]|nr:hypothetical protein [bacterium]